MLSERLMSARCVHARTPHLHLHLHLPLRSTHSFPYKYNVYKPLGFCYTVSRDCYVKQTQTDLMSHRRGLPFEEVLQPEYNMGHNWTDCTQIPTVMHWTVLRIKIENILESNNCQKQNEFPFRYDSDLGFTLTEQIL